MNTKVKTTSLNREVPIFLNLENKNVKKLKLKPGDISTVKITALGANNIGLAEIANGYTVIVPKAKLGETVKIKIEKISPKPKYAIARLIETVNETTVTVPIEVNEILSVKIEKQGPQNSGLVQLTNNFTLIVEGVEKTTSLKVGEEVQVQILRIKEKYAFAKVVYSSGSNSQQRPGKLRSANVPTSDLRIPTELLNSLKIGSSFNIQLPKNAKFVGNYTVIKLKKSLVFVKLSLGAQLGDIVRIQIVKTTARYSMAKITKIAPIAKNLKNLSLKSNLQKMITSGMHYGEKAIRCHANMRKFLWIRKKGKNQNRPLMKRGRHIINILKTRSCLEKSLEQLGKYAAKGKTFLFVGTKKPASSLIARTAMLTKTSYFVNTRWLGGMLTNWKTILKSISQIRPILKEKQKIIEKILEKRQKIKKRLLIKVSLLRKKSEKLLTKGKELLSQIKKDRNILFSRTQNLLTKKKSLVSKNQELLKKYSELKLQKQKSLLQIQKLTQQGNVLIKQKTLVINQIKIVQTQLKEFNQLNEIGQEILKLKVQFKNQGKEIWTIPFENTVNLIETQNGILPNPSFKVLNTIISLMKLKYETSTSNTLIGTNRSKAVNDNTVIMSQLLNKLTDYLPFIQNYMNVLSLRIQTLQTICTNVNSTIEEIREKLNVLTNKDFHSKLDTTLNFILNKFKIEQENLKRLKQKLKQLAAEQKLLKFLPKLRYLPTSKKKMIETVEFLMKKFVDPKMSYSMDQIYNQKLKFTSKKLAATRKQKWQRLEKYFGGITKMAKMKRKQITNNIVILVGQQEEMNAVRECRKLGMKMFTIVDTNCNPQLSDYIIPANDDSRNSIKFILGKMLTHIRLGQKLRKKILSKNLA